MIINRIEIPADKSQGLKKVSMSRLGQIVLIAGKNGSGKSRILAKIKDVLRKKPTSKQIDDQKKSKENHLAEISKAEAQLENFETAVKNGNTNRDVKMQLTSLPLRIEQLKKGLLTIENTLDWSNIETNELSTSYACLDFVPKQLELKDCNSFTKQAMQEQAKSLEVVGINNTPNGTLSKIQQVQNQWFNATHQSSTITEEKISEIKTNYETLCGFIKIFLNAELGRDQEGDATIFGFRLGQARLSDGQKVLLQLCIALYSQKSKLSDLIIFMDEPENHLHPQALIEVVDKMKEVLPNGQLWIATHSINLLAHYEPTSIWYMENGHIKYSGNVPERVLNGLMGDEQEISKLKDFLSLPAQMGTNQFAFESLLAPISINTGKDDPQTNQIIVAIESLLEANKKIRVLDFGAGKGRLLSTILESNSLEDKPVSDWLDYYAFDLPSSDKDDCVSIINSVYNNDKTRYFDNEGSFVESIKQNSFDVIILCNVFHEIDPSDWLKLFDTYSLILSALSVSGTLLIVEDQLLAIGEKAYQNGFLVFDKIQFKKLFKIEDDYSVHDARNDGRLRAHFIPAGKIKNIDQDSKVDAIKSLNATATRKVLELRSSEPSYKNGRLHGFWVQQLANSLLVMNEFGVK
jgi:energy-coupling factor transporter ATP-binding protein EcfA2